MPSDSSDVETGLQSQVDSLHWGTLSDWSQLVRIPTVFTLISNCVAAAVVAVGEVLPLDGFLPALLASMLAYWAGMILNDVTDLEEDRQLRPNRPLAADRISPTIAGHVGTSMLLVAPIITLGIVTFHDTQPLWMGAAFLCAFLLSVCVRLYSSPLKRTPLGPLLMGSCRALNILTVGTTMFAISEFDVFPNPLLGLASGIGLYVLGVTVVAWKEEGESSQVILGLGLVFETAGLVTLATLTGWIVGEPPGWSLEPNAGFPLLIGLIGVTVLRRGVSAIMHPVSRKVQLAVKHALLSLILLDAAIVVMWAGIWYGAAVVCLLIPALAIAIRYRTT